MRLRIVLPLLAVLCALAVPASARNPSKDLRRLHERGSQGGGRWALVVRELQPGKTKDVYVADERARMIPASTTKLFTCYTAAAMLPADTSFETTVSTSATIDKGVLTGDIWLRGWGAPGIRARSRGAAPPDTASLVLARLAQKVREMGIRSIAGDVRVDNSFYEDADSIGAGWQADDLPWWYAAPVTPLAVDDNAAELTWRPGPQATGGMPQMAAPAFPRNWDMLSAVRFSTEGQPTDIHMRWTAGRSAWLSGWMSPSDSVHRETVAIARPELYAADCFRLLLEGERLRFTPRAPEKVVSGPGRELGAVVWPSLREIYAPILGRSQNLEAEMLLRNVAAARGRAASVRVGTALVNEEMTRLGLEPGSWRLVDGSGLSRGNSATAEALARIVESAVRRADSGDAGMANLLSGLARPGELGSLLTRFRGDEWSGLPAGWLRAKTGSMDGVSAFAGVLSAPNGKRYVFASIRNNFPEVRRQATAWEEAVVRAVLGMPPPATTN